MILFRSAAAVEKDIRWDGEDEGNHVLFACPNEAFENVEKAIERLCKRFETDDVLMCLSAGRNFRYSIYPDYKANRKGTRKPLTYFEIVERIEKAYPTFKHDGLEADDVMGIFGSRNANSIVCSADKDLKSVPCTVWDGKSLQKIDKATADYNFLYQTLVGDTADGYPGLPGCGPKGAIKLLTPSDGAVYAKKPLQEWAWPKIVTAYEKKGLTEADAITQARLARILRNSDWDGKKKQPILWTP